MGQGDPGSQHQSAVRQSKRSEAAKPAISGQCFRIGTHLVSFRLVSLPYLSHPKLAVRIGTSHSRQGTKSLRDSQRPRPAVNIIPR